MLSELFAYLTTPCPQYVRHMDYLSEATGLRRRSRKNRAAWQPHLERSRAFVLEAAERCRDRNKAVILGAGLLLDVPLAELSTMFGEVVLLDVVLLPEVRRMIKQYGNVKFIQIDVTNMAEKLYNDIRLGIRSLPQVSSGIPDCARNAGLIVSLNILSQLWVVPRAYVLKKLPGIEEEQLEDWCRHIMESHYGFLRSQTCTVCLVADHEFVNRDRDGRIVNRGSTVANFLLPEPQASWTWNITPMVEGSRSLAKELNVGAWHLR